ncbi:MAG TPA: SRPBCC domain-containing protein [Rhizomicrobium sp.]|nr:SRPBCC domain-containing protein [Rhizomicrobium sp.]
MVDVTTPSDREMVVTRAFNAPRHLVYQCWTKPVLVKHWLYGPETWKLVTCEIDLRVGGKLRFVWGAVQSASKGMSGVYQDIIPDERLVFTENFDEDWTGGETLVTLQWREQNGHTIQTQTVLYSSKQARDSAMSTDMIEGMKQGDERLEKLLETLSPTP